jgi:hypothetical protein
VYGWRSPWAAVPEALGRPGSWPIALAGFLARGGIVLFVAPIVSPPSLVGLATFISPASITPTGPTSGLILRIVVAASVLGGALLAGTIAGSAAELALIEQTPGASGEPPAGLLRRIVLIRLIGLLPVAIVLGAGVQGLGQIVYQELTLPSDLVTPMVIRVADRAPAIVAAIILAWLAGETLAGLATRLAVVSGAGVGRALGLALGLAVRRANTVVPLAVLSVLLAAGVLGLVIGLVAWSWDFVRDQLLATSGSGDLLALAGSTLLFIACWLIGLTIAGALAAGRGVAWTLLVGQDHRGSGGTAPERATL